MDQLPEELIRLKRFHGHLGPYVVVGYRMGQLARQRLEGKLTAVAFTGTKTPLSCLVDGVQFSSSCTLGKGNISIQDKGEARAHFFNDRVLLDIKLDDEVKKSIDDGMSKETEEATALAIYNEPEEELFEITEVESELTERTLKLR
ncbi:MAG TPA: formylmethanofuran dehydrogenase subunit E family protein [Methanomassiliicoccales archaeon]|jgi:formylmethanofuran dehydrogenase subunit E|nr:formylmethanofuran dehydrogenase subunit E family protein [Methanomassiliicoccales archaeon]